MKCLSLCSALLAMAAGPVFAGDIVAPPTSDSASSEFNASFAVGNLFDATVTAADVGVTAYGGTGQYAGAGLGPHDLWLDFGSTINGFDGIVYSQRAGSIATTDKVIQMDFFFSNTDLTGTDLSTLTPDATVPITNLADTILTEYSLGPTTFDSQFVGIRLTGNGGNPGGSELRLTATGQSSTVPEPTSLVIWSVIGVGLAVGIWRRRGNTSPPKE